LYSHHEKIIKLHTWPIGENFLMIRYLCWVTVLFYKQLELFK
jgi:hypothetical protein